ncbi:MAG: phage baseplate assembly protein [Candidatus Anammoxibacter sp.]
MLTIEVNGVNFETALSIRVRRSIHNFLGFFDVESSADPENLLPIKVGDVIKVLADGKQILLGFIDRLSMQQSADDHTITFSGRDRTSDVFDSTVTGDLKFQGPISYIDVLRQTLDAGNLNAIDIVNEVGDIDNFTDQDIIAYEVGTTIFNFMEPYARKRQFLMTTNEEGNILLMQGSTDRLGIDLIHKIDNRLNNVISSTYDKNIELRFNRYIAKSQLNPFGSLMEPDDIADQSGESEPDSEIRASRIMTFNVEEDTNNDVSFNRAQFEANIRRANSLNYSAVIQGHTINGGIIKVNRLAFVQDDFADIASDMLIHTIEFNYSLRAGSITTLSLTFPDAFTLAVEQSAREAARSELGGGFDF